MAVTVGLLVIFGFKVWIFVYWLVGFNELVLFLCSNAVML